MVNGDRMVEITEAQPIKRRIFESRELQRKAYLEASIAKFQAELDECNANLAIIQTEATAYEERTK
jgi:hypothetical protein